MANFYKLPAAQCNNPVFKFFRGTTPQCFQAGLFRDYFSSYFSSQPVKFSLRQHYRYPFQVHQF